MIGTSSSWRTYVAVSAILSSVIPAGDDVDDPSKDVVTETLDVLSRYSSVLSSAMEKDSKGITSSSSDCQRVEEYVLLEESCRLWSQNSLLMKIVFQTLSGRLGLVSATSLMAFVLRDRPSSQGQTKEAYCDTSDSILWEVVTQCLGNKVELGIRSAISQHQDYVSNPIIVDGIAGEACETIASSSAAMNTLDRTSDEVQNAVNYTIRRVMSLVLSSHIEEVTGGKVPPRVSRLLEDLRAFLLSAQTFMLELYYARLYVFDGDTENATSSAVSNICAKRLAEAVRDALKDVVGMDKPIHIRMVEDLRKTLQDGGSVPII